MTKNVIIVGMADLNVMRNPGMLTTLGLGSCVGLNLYDPSTKICGMAHIMLPDSKTIKNNSNRAKFVDTATMDLLARMKAAGANLRGLKAKVAGGAQMFALNTANESMKIGQRNSDALLKLLKSLNIPVIAKDVGLNYGRTIELYTEDGRLVIKTIGHGTKTI
ncbi:MAG: chemotaxis protein CheD [Defluviitaleaceae bacterium]|nr:chemotaxis protein CheD [Defluviitaleaceae bacterium]